ncbi:MAG: V-type ATP synthase subunit E family protein [Proteobacteria bacterium]|nr:V-type ATP synthase subunit E family protein [Pseudomonadota bacterium]
METDQDSTEKLREEILTDAKNDREKIIIRARQEAEVILSNAAAEADRVHQEQLDHAVEDAARSNELILATVSVETGRLRAARIEALLESVYEEVCRRLLARDGFEYRETVIALASHAINQMAGSAFVAKLPEADFNFLGDGLADEIARRVGRPVSVTISYEPVITGGGVIVEDTEGRQVWDNRLAKRLERLWPELRRQIAVQAAFVPANTNVDLVN